MAKDTAHRDDLAFVMEGVSEDVMQDECGRPDQVTKPAPWLEFTGRARENIHEHISGVRETP